MKNPLNLVKKANRSFNLYLENFGKYQKVISDYYKNQEVFNNFLAEYHKRKDSKVNERLYKSLRKNNAYIGRKLLNKCQAYH